jgi:hypothetical protein
VWGGGGGGVGLGIAGGVTLASLPALEAADWGIPTLQ